MTDIFQQLWNTYVTVNPNVELIKKLFENQGETVINDHIALRTFDDPRINISVLAQTFLKQGYEEKKTYEFQDKKLIAKHYDHPNPLMPKVFISELELAKFSTKLQKTVDHIVSQVTPQMTDAEGFVNCGRPWQSISFANYESLRQESEYAAWLYAWGFMANHFTVKVNHLKKFPTISAVNEFLESHGITLNAAGGKIKGSKEAGLEQSSTMANKQFIEFLEGKKEIPSCYYEFAFRHQTAAGTEFSDFIADNANKIFESTNMH